MADNATQYLRHANRRSPNPAKVRSVLVHTTRTPVKPPAPKPLTRSQVTRSVDATTGPKEES